MSRHAARRNMKRYLSMLCLSPAGSSDRRYWTFQTAINAWEWSSPRALRSDGLDLFVS
jgi:hypothetical protein